MERGTPRDLAWSGGPPVLGDLLGDDGRPDLLFGGSGGVYLYTTLPFAGRVYLPLVMR